MYARQKIPETLPRQQADMPSSPAWPSESVIVLLAFLAAMFDE